MVLGPKFRPTRRKQNWTVDVTEKDDDVVRHTPLLCDVDFHFPRCLPALSRLERIISVLNSYKQYANRSVEQGIHKMST